MLQRRYSYVWYTGKYSPCYFGPCCQWTILRLGEFQRLKLYLLKHKLHTCVWANSIWGENNPVHSMCIAVLAGRINTKCIHVQCILNQATWFGNPNKTESGRSHYLIHAKIHPFLVQLHLWKCMYLNRKWIAHKQVFQWSNVCPMKSTRFSI